MIGSLAATIDKVEAELAASGELTKDDNAHKHTSTKQDASDTVTHHYRLTIDAETQDSHQSGKSALKSDHETSHKKKRASCWCFGKASK